MQYVRNLSDSVSTAWNSINPATLSGAIDVIVVEHSDGSLSCSPFHVRFGKFSLLRPYEKKVEFRINGLRQEYSMKLGEGGEAFFVFETTDTVPESLQTSPLVSPATSPPLDPASELQEPDSLELNAESSKARRPLPAVLPPDDHAMLTPLSTSPALSADRSPTVDWPVSLLRPHSDELLRPSARGAERDTGTCAQPAVVEDASERSHSPPPLAPRQAIERARVLSKELSAANIPTQVTDAGDLMLDMTGFKSSEEDMLRAEVLARQILTEELDGDYNIGALFGFDDLGNLWIYSSEEAKQAAMNKTIESSLQAHRQNVAADAASDPGYHSDGSDVPASPRLPSHRRSESDAGPSVMHVQTPPRTPPELANADDLIRNYAKTLRLTSNQLKELDLKPGENLMSFTVNRATCSANMYLWKEETPVVISDIDGTITKSDALGHVLNMIGRDWTHSGVAKLYSDIALNGYNIMYLTSRSVGQADTTRAYVNGIVQEGYKMPHGPTILSPDRTMAALRREIYLRKPHIFKMATLRDIRNLYDNDLTPFYAGFGNRLTDQISYRTVDVPRTRIFTINSNSEVSLDLLSLNKLKMSYVNINEVVDHYFPPVGTLVTGGGEEYTDFKYWRNDPLALDEFSASDSDGDNDDDDDALADQASTYSNDNDDDDEDGDGLGDGYISCGSLDETPFEERPAESTASINKADDADEDDYYGDNENSSGNEPSGDLVPNNVAITTRDPMPTESRLLAADVTSELITGVGHLPWKNTGDKKTKAEQGPRLSGAEIGLGSGLSLWVEEPVEIRPTPGAHQ